MRVRIIFATLSLFAASPAFADQHDADRHPEDVPAALEPQGDEKLSFVALGVGVQIYTCALASGAWQWVFRAPEADLYSGGGVIGTHYAGPTWEANNGGTVRAAVAARVNSPDPTAIPWLRLTAVANEGPGLFSGVTMLQRLATTGGRAPAAGCDASTPGVEARVPYTALYYFYKAHDNRN